MTRKRIIASALSLFADKGYDKTTFEEVARRLSMTKGAVYWHFPNKQALLLAIVHEVHERFDTDMLKGRDRKSITFAEAVDILAGHAAGVAADPEAACLYMILHSRIRWGETSMTELRGEIIGSAYKGGPFALLKTALENEAAAGRFRGDLSTDDTAGAMLFAWSSLIRAQIEGFIKKDLKKTVRTALQIFRDGWLPRGASAARKTGR